ncbi:uncharacterized protein LOC129593970 [Paramacrobiotus metropolitanus]|uniref:uncharacterized protein LOC129593970 n=1 Tax=Paramacrobiotus metropolitanus TaxID=2943436 RepID=UPI002445CFB5|nr:uncharacterized protein LOC129593970 [Paramacrobiotus metropolitanus]
MAQQLSVVRFTKDFVPCRTSPVTELGWFGLTNQHEDPACKDFIDDKEKRSVRLLSQHWDSIRNTDLDDRYHLYESRAAENPVSNWRPLAHMQTWIKKNPEVFHTFKPDIVCSSRALKQALDIPHTYGSFSETFLACKRQGTIYLTCKKFDALGNALPVNHQKAYRMRRYEQLVAGTSNDGQSDDFTTFDYFYSVIGRTIGRTRLLYHHKIDCIDPQVTSSPENYVQLVVNEDRPAQSQRQRCSRKYQNAVRGTWSKCFLNGSPRALVGRKKDNILFGCAMTVVARIPDSASVSCENRRCKHWNKERNISFLNQFLEYVRNTVQQDYEHTVYGFVVDYSNQDIATVRATEWCAGSANFEANNILRTWDQVSDNIGCSLI